MSFFVQTLVLLVALTHVTRSWWPFSTTVTKEFESKLVPAEYRNIIFVGRSRSGKTTVIEVLKDALYSPNSSTILGGTVNASVKSFTMATDSGKDIHFNLMDTPGLFQRSNEEYTRSNRMILELIKKSIDMQITKINHIYFTIPVTPHGLNPEDLLSFDLFTQLFVGMESKISIIITSSEFVTTEGRKHYRNDIRNVTDMLPLWDKDQNRILFLGAAQQSNLMKNEKLEKLQNHVKKQRSALLKHIIEESDSVDVKKLKVYKDNLSFLKELRRKFDDCCECTQQCDQKGKFNIFLNQYLQYDNDKDTVTNLFKEKHEL